MLEGTIQVKRKTITEEKIIAAALCGMVVLVTAQVLSRYAAHKSLSYTEEIVRYMFVWITFLGISAAVVRGRHLSLAESIHVVPVRYRHYLRYIRGAAALLFAGILNVYGTKVTLLQLKTGQTTAALGLPMWIVGLALPVCSFIFILRVLQNAFRKEPGE
jgi:TRAP-type C4-dicarboxylate transport system permease small subunit